MTCINIQQGPPSANYDEGSTEVVTVIFIQRVCDIAIFIVASERRLEWEKYRQVHLRQEVDHPADTSNNAEVPEVL